MCTDLSHYLANHFLSDVPCFEGSSQETEKKTKMGNNNNSEHF